MSENNIHISSEALPLVRDRARIWDDLDDYAARAKEIQDLAQQAPKASTADTISALTPDNAPPHEIVAAIAEMRSELAAIKKAQQTVNVNDNQIANIQSAVSRFWTTVIVLGVGGAVGLILLIGNMM